MPQLYDAFIKSVKFFAWRWISKLGKQLSKREVQLTNGGLAHNKDVKRISSPIFFYLVAAQGRVFAVRCERLVHLRKYC